MRQLLAGIAALILLALLNAYAAESTEVDKPVVTMKRIPGWKSRSYEIHIYSDGLVRYRGHRNVAVIGERESRVSGDDVKSLLQSFADSQFSSLSNEYILKGLMDSSILELTLNLPPQPKTVRIQTILSGPASDKLNALGQKIDELVGSDQWVRK
jgi:hypothetical protein